MAVELLPLRGLPQVRPGDDIAELICAAATTSQIQLQDGDVLAISGKIVSKAEGRVIDLRTVRPSPRAQQLAVLTEKDPRLVEVVLQESVEVIRARPGILLVRHHLGYVSAAAGLDRSNVSGDNEEVLLLPLDPDQSAASLRNAIADRLGIGIAVIVTDSHGRPFRVGNAGVAIGAAGLTTVRSLEGRPDLFGHPLTAASVVPTADLIASAAMLVSGEADEGIPAVVVRGVTGLLPETGTARELIRDPARDLFAAPDTDYP